MVETKGTLTLEDVKLKGIEVNYEELTEDQSMMFLGIISTIDTEFEDLEQKFADVAFIYKIVKKRVASFGVADRFSDKALMLAEVYAKGNPGAAIFYLIDLLSAYTGDITENEVIKRYSEGYYTIDTIQKIVDKYVKSGEYKYSELY